MKLSIIIPVYNVEDYITECLNSILIQKLKNYEIIIIDDGSTDKSGKICDEFKKRYKEIKVIHQKNKGLSEARNTGIRKSKGKYLMFIDSDDFINRKINLNKVIDNINTDILQYNFIKYYPKSNKYIYEKTKKLHNENDTFKLLLKKVKDGSFSIQAWNKIVKRNIIVDNNLYFKKGILSEDLEWSLRLYLHVKTIHIINENIYIYRKQRKGSITFKSTEKQITSLYNIIDFWYKKIYKNKMVKQVYLNYLAYQYIILLTILDNKNYNKEMKEKIYNLRKILKYQKNYKVFMCKILFKIFGLHLGVKILKEYINIREKMHNSSI